MFSRLTLIAPIACLLWVVVQSVTAGPLSEAYAKAVAFDAQVQAARAERDVNQISAKTAAAAYYPQFQASYSQLETETSPRQTYTVSQPLLNADRYFTLQEATPRELFAAATYQVREQDLSQRLVKAVSELLRNHESLGLNKAKISALEKQALSAQRSFEVGQGTVTDVRDTKVRLDQSRAESMMLEAQISASERQITALTGAPASPLMLSIPRAARGVILKPQDHYINAAMQGSPQLVLARQSQRIGELAVRRADGAIWPTLSAVLTVSASGGDSKSYTGISLGLPLQASTFYQSRSAAAGATKLLEQTRDAELRAGLDVQRLWALVNAGRSEVAIRLEAIQSAELSVEGNEKSFRGGVRSQIDVLNSIQTLFQVRQDYVNSVLTLAENYLNLLLQAATPPEDAIAQVQTVLFPGR